MASSIKRADATSPSSHDTGGSSAIRRPPATDNVGIFLYVFKPSSAASCSWSLKDSRCRGWVTEPSPQPPARNPPDLPDAAAAISTRSTTVHGTPRLERKYAQLFPMMPPPSTTTFLSARASGVGDDDAATIAVLTTRLDLRRRVRTPGDGAAGSDTVGIVKRGRSSERCAIGRSVRVRATRLGSDLPLDSKSLSRSGSSDRRPARRLRPADFPPNRQPPSLTNLKASI